MLVTPFVVVEIVGIDLLRELGFVMILWPAHIYYSSTFQFMPNAGKWDKSDNCQPHSAMLARHTWPFVEERRGVLTVGRFAWAGISHRQRLMVQPELQGKWPLRIWVHDAWYVGEMLSWQASFKMQWVPTWSWEGRGSGLAPLHLLSCSTLVVLSRPRHSKIRIH